MDSTGTRTYLRDGAYVTGPVLSDGAAMYTPGISERRSSVTKFYHPDRLGTTERLTDTNQSTTDTRQYDAFGLLTSSSGNTPTPFGFAGAWGYQEDPDSGLKLLGHRYYDPSTGRFLTRDPIKDGRNWYGYARANPCSFVDPSGLIIPILLIIAGGMIIGGVIGAISDPDDRWRGFGRGAVLGGVAAAVGVATGGAATAGLGAIGIGGVGGGMISGGLAGATGSAAAQGTAIILEWQDEFWWPGVAAGGLGGSILGGITFRPVPASGPVEVTHWGPPGPWVQTGGPTKLNHLLAGAPKGAPSTTVVDGGKLVSPGGIEYGKGLFGQRVIKR